VLNCKVDTVVMSRVIESSMQIDYDDTKTTSITKL
jgi:hypothetical protein